MGVAQPFTLGLPYLLLWRGGVKYTNNKLVGEQKAR